MSLTKYASFEVSKVLDIKSSPTKVKTAKLDKIGDFHDYRTEDGYLYVRIRAISSRTNKNNDGWPTAELAGGKDAWERISSQHQASEGGFRIEADTTQEYGFPTFIGKPIFVDHNNSDPRRSRGVIADSAFNVLDHKTAAEGDEYWGSEDVDPEHMPPAEVELLLEVDAKEFPKFAKAILNGDLDGFSMGCDVDYSKCSHCGHVATAPDEYCSHIIMKGAEHTSDQDSRFKGKTARSYENCYGIKFFEISGVFDPADETALTKEVRSSVNKEGGPYLEPEVEDIERHARIIMADNPGMTLEEAMPFAQSELMNRFNVDPAQVHGEGVVPDHVKVKDTLPLPREISVATPRRQGSFLASKTADHPEPQSFQTTAPEDVNTLREERICPLCGSDMDADRCDVCGYEEPPEQFQNPDLNQAHDVDLTQQDQNEITIPPDEDVPPPEGDKGESYLKTRNQQPTASVKVDMRWAPKGIDFSKLAAESRGDEPDETVTSDQTKPVTSTFRTAQELIATAAAKRNQEKDNMSDQTKVAADPADPSGKAKTRVDVEGVGGVDEASAESASKADAQVDVQGKGGVLDASNESASAPDEKQSVEETSDNAGFDDGGNKDNNSGPTKTFDNSNEPSSAVSDRAFPTSAKKGTDPADPVGKAEERVDVEEQVNDTSNNSGPTKTWTGTDGNGVTRQRDPVTNKPTQSQGIKSHISLAALKLADAEVELGLTDKSDKYNRLAELAELDDVEIAAEQRAVAKVAKAGLGPRTASKSRGLPFGRMPSFTRIASETPAEPQPVDDALLDSAMFSR